MALSSNQKNRITELLSEKIDQKLDRYGRETTAMPFLARLVQDSEKIAAYSFIHSLATTLGMSIYEEVSCIIASEHCDVAHRNYDVGGVLSGPQKEVINDIVTALRNGSRKANIAQEKKEVLAASAENGKFQRSGNIADFYMKKDGCEYFFEIKTVKPNIDVFEKSKTKLLEWVARRRADVKVYLAFPYNPYHPNPYDRFTESGMMDAPADFLVGEAYWDFIGGPNTFPDLLNVFDAVGKEYKGQLHEKFRKIAENMVDSY